MCVGGGVVKWKWRSKMQKIKKFCIKQTFWRKDCRLRMSPLAGVWLQALLSQASVGVAYGMPRLWCCAVGFFSFLQLVFHPALCPPCRWAVAPPPSHCPLLFCSRFLKPGIIAGRERPAPFANGYSNDPLGRQQFSVAADVSRCRNISISLNIEASAFSYSGGKKDIWHPSKSD